MPAELVEWLRRCENNMEFWKIEHSPAGLAVIEPSSGRQKSYGELRSDVNQIFMPNGRSLIFLLAQNRYECLCVYLAALQSDNPVLLIDASLDRTLLQGLVDTYRPAYIYGLAPDLALPGYLAHPDGALSILERQSRECIPLHESLALLLNTSGSTGSPKLVRLSRQNLEANAVSIASYLELSGSERPLTSLPMSYSYGLSVINSHLLAGAALSLTDYGVLRREFWDTLDQCACTSLAGVPYTYQMLLETSLLTRRGKTLRTLTQAGGALGDSYTRRLHQLAQERGFRFFVMYGQTEATARISYLPFEKLGDKIGSIGIAIPNGRLELEADSGELVYRGPNVMLGYAECLEDLARGDELGGVLRTGDLARQDTDGFFYITGRLKRFLKLFGKRFNLDEVEQIVQSNFGFPIACFGRDDLLMLAFEGSDGVVPKVLAMVREKFRLPQDSIQVEAHERLPRTLRGKIDYQSLLAMHGVSSSALTATEAVR
ncbi:MAG: AMP-binding protein [Acidobacteria bacterium]|nr:AMP-binding protein [Acidobacteriota bacterium]